MDSKDYEEMILKSMFTSKESLLFFLFLSPEDFVSKLGFKYKVGDLLILLKGHLGIHKNQVGDQFKMDIPKLCHQNSKSEESRISF